MAVPSGTATSFDLPNFTSFRNEVFQTSVTRAPFSQMLGGLNGFVSVDSPQFTDQDIDLAAASQDTAVEGDDPTASHRSRDDVLNVVEIHQHAVQIAYSKLAAVGLITTDNANLRSNTANLGVQPVRNEVDFQADLKFEQIRINFEFALFQGTFANPATNGSARQTRGVNAHITTNSVAAGSTDLSRDHLQELWRTMADNGARFDQVVAFADSLQVQRISDIYGYAPESRTVGGVAINQIITEFGNIGVQYAPFNLNSVVSAVELSTCVLVDMPIPGMGTLFFEPLARTGSSVKGQIYGEIGAAYGPETFHGEVTGLSTS